MRAALLLVLASAGFAASAAAADPQITYRRCTDMDFCRAETCQSATMPSLTCQPFSPTVGPDKGRNFSQALKCDATVHSCGVLWLHPDQYCGELVATETVLCNQCNPVKKQSALCQNRNGQESVQLVQCDDSACSSNCRPIGVIPAGYCFNMGNASNPVYARYSGAQLCTTVEQIVWANGACSGQPAGVQRIPSGRCMAGGEVSCNYFP